MGVVVIHVVGLLRTGWCDVSGRMAGSVGRWGLGGGVKEKEGTPLGAIFSFVQARGVEVERRSLSEAPPFRYI